MKITAIETLVCHARMRNWVFVKVVTDLLGLLGWGEATLGWHTRSVVGAVEDLSNLLIGQDPTRVEHLWQSMWRQHFWHGHGVVRSTAIAGIDLALWDIVGKLHGLGISINEQEVARHPYEPELLQRVFYRDGAVGDW